MFCTRRGMELKPIDVFFRARFPSELIQFDELFLPGVPQNSDQSTCPFCNRCPTSLRPVDSFLPGVWRNWDQPCCFFTRVSVPASAATREQHGVGADTPSRSSHQCWQSDLHVQRWRCWFGRAIWDCQGTSVWGSAAPERWRHWLAVADRGTLHKPSASTGPDSIFAHFRGPNTRQLQGRLVQR
jgi:hypothetical protein